MTNGMIGARLTFAVYILAATAGALLYQTSYAVDELHGKISNTERQIVAEQENIQVLGAEWTYLTEPGRIEALASKYLHLEATKTQRVAALHDMNRVVAQANTQTNMQVNTDIETPVAVIAAAAQPPLIAPMPDPAAQAPTAPIIKAAIKPIVTANAAASRAISPLLSTAAQKQSSSQSTTPGSVKLLLASFQSQQR